VVHRDEQRVSSSATRNQPPPDQRTGFQLESRVRFLCNQGLQFLLPVERDPQVVLSQLNLLFSAGTIR